MVGGEFLGELAGGGVNPDTVGWRHGVENFGGGGAVIDCVLHGEVQIVKQQGHKSLRQCGGGWLGFLHSIGLRMIGDCDYRNDTGGWCFQAEGGNGLRLAVIEKLEIFFLQIVYDFAALIANHDPNQHQVHADLESCSGIASDDFGSRRRLRRLLGRLRGRGLGRRGLREKRRSDRQKQQCKERQ